MNSNEAVLNMAHGVEQETTSEMKDIQRGWDMAARYYWGMAYVAMTERRFRAMREMAETAKEASEKTGLGGVLLASIFDDGKIPPAPEQAVKIGERIPENEFISAREEVLAEIKRHNDAKKPAVTAAPKSAKASKGEARIALQAWIASQGGEVSKGEAEEWAAENGYRAVMVRAMECDGELISTRRGHGVRV